MTPLQIAQLIAQFLPYGIEFAAEILAVAHQPAPTLADWQRALAKAKTPFAAGLKDGVLLPDKTP